MSVAELRELEEVKGLITHGLQVGVLTYAEIATATAELGLDETDVEELHGLFERCEIELVEEIDPATAASLNIERAPEKRTRRKAALDLKPEGTTDGLQLAPMRRNPSRPASRPTRSNTSSPDSARKFVSSKHLNLQGTIHNHHYRA